jgi:hypothetical protein
MESVQFDSQSFYSSDIKSLFKFWIHKIFVDPETGAHTNTIEGTWNAIKRKISIRNRVRLGMEEELWKFIWKRNHSVDLWGGFINALRNVEYQ